MSIRRKKGYFKCKSCETPIQLNKIGNFLAILFFYISYAFSIFFGFAIFSTIDKKNINLISKINDISLISITFFLFFSFFYVIYSFLSLFLGNELKNVCRLENSQEPH